MKSKLLLLACLVVALAVEPVGATTYYVAPGGSNSNSGTSEGSPFADPGGCVSNMGCGDICLIKDGTYTKNGSAISRPGWDFCTSGMNCSSGNPAVIQAYPGDFPIIRSTTNAPIGVGALNGSPDCSHITFGPNLRIDGGMSIWGQDTGQLNNITVTGNEIYGGGMSCDGNWTIMFVNEMSDFTFEYNYLHGFDSSGCSQRSSAALLKTFCIRDSKFNYNTFDGNDPVSAEAKYGLDLKDTPRNIEAKHNIFKGTTSGAIRVTGQTDCPEWGSTYNMSIEGNLFLDDASIEWQRLTSGTIKQNTFASSGAGNAGGIALDTNTSQLASVDIADNLFVNTGTNFSVSASYGANMSGQDISYQLYDSDGIYFKKETTTYTALSSWTSAIRSAGCSGCETNSQEFANPCSGGFTSGTDSDWHIESGMCTTFASDGGEVGAYGATGATECVGHTCSGGGGPPTGGETCTDPAAEWIFCDDFETGDLSLWTGDSRVTQGFAVEADESAYDGSYSLKFPHVSGVVSENWISVYNFDHSDLSSPGAYQQDIYRKGRMKFENGFNFSNAVKVAITAIHGDWDCPWIGPNCWSPMYCTFFVSGSNPGQPKLQCNIKSGGGLPGTGWHTYSQNQDNTFTVTDNSWVSWQMYMKLNTSGQSNGTLKLWINDLLRLEETGLNLIGTYTDYGINHLMLNSSASPASANQDQWWDLHIISTEMIEGGTDPGEPNPPRTRRMLP